MHLKMSSAEVDANNCQTLMMNLSIEANSVDPEQTAWSSPTLFVIEASYTFQQTRKADDFCCDWRFKGKYSKAHVLF